MSKITQTDFAKFMHELKKVLPKYSPEMNDGVIKAWYSALHELEVEGLREIYAYCRDNLDAFPSIKFIKELVNYGSDDMPNDPMGELIKAVQTRRFRDLHPAILELSKRLGGFERIGEWNVDQYDYKRRMVDQIWQNIQIQWKTGSLEDHREEMFNTLPPANVMKVIEAGAKEAIQEKPEKVDRSNISLKGWIDDIRAVEQKTKVPVKE